MSNLIAITGEADLILDLTIGTKGADGGYPAWTSFAIVIMALIVERGRRDVREYPAISTPHSSVAGSD